MGFAHGIGAGPEIDVADAFGAKVEVTPGSGRTLAIVIGHQDPRPLVSGAGGHVVISIDDLTVVALLEVTAVLGLRHDPGIRVAGPVNVNEDRFERFAALAGLGT